MKKIALLVVSTVMLCSLAACGVSDNGADDTKTSTVVSTPVATEAPEEVVTLGDELFAIDESAIAMKLPSNFALNDGWSCYSDTSFATSIWLKDSNVYENVEDVDKSINNFGYTYTEEKIGNFSVKIVENKESFYGAQTDYYVTFDAPIAGYAGCRIWVTNNTGDMSATQTAIIKEAIASISAK